MLSFPCNFAGTCLATASQVGNSDSKRPLPPSVSDRPVRDEWGIYDPEQAGFAAIFRKLNDVKKDDRDVKPSGDRT